MAIAMHNVKVITHGDSEHFNIFQLTVLVLWPTALLFWFSLTALIHIVSSSSRQLFSARKNPLWQTHCTLPFQQQTEDKVSCWLVNTVQYLAAKESCIPSVSGDQSRAKRRIKTELTFVGLQTHTSQQLYQVIICQCCVYWLFHCHQAEKKSADVLLSQPLLVTVAFLHVLQFTIIKVADLEFLGIFETTGPWFQIEVVKRRLLISNRQLSILLAEMTTVANYLAN